MQAGFDFCSIEIYIFDRLNTGGRDGREQHQAQRQEESESFLILNSI